MRPSTTSWTFAEWVRGVDPLLIDAALIPGRPNRARGKAKDVLARQIASELRRDGSSAAGIARVLGCSQKTVYRLAERAR
jgi:DNA invertase Pin-like site-specific DNA recombinase